MSMWFDDRLVSEEEEYLHALENAAYDRFLDVAVKCRDCGTLYDQKYHEATRSEPAWVECDECPNCGSGEIKERTGTAEGRIG
jgi:formate dehydrogenase maturation protein FdhE